MPKGFRTETGNRKRLAQEYGMKEHQSSGYPARTAANVNDSDGTLLFVWGKSPGTELTRRECEKASKPIFVVELNLHQVTERKWGTIKADASSVLSWINSQGIKTLNVAGPRESRAQGVCAFVDSFLMDVFLLDIGI